MTKIVIKNKKEPTPISKTSPILPWNSAQTIALESRKVVPGDNKSVSDIVRSASLSTGVNPSFLLKSAWQEGMNKAVYQPDTISLAYENAAVKNPQLSQFPVDGFYFYGTDTFGEPGVFEKLSAKGYLPKGFEQRFSPYEATNEKNQLVRTAAFKSHEDALTAKAAMLRDIQDQVEDYAKKKGIKLGEEEKAYFTSASYNAGFGRGKQIIDEFVSSPNKKEFISKGLTAYKQVHQNVYPRISNLDIISKEINPQKTKP
jgi:hypothetical protein